MTVPAYANVGTETQAVAASATANCPTSTANGDLLIMVIAFRDTTHFVTIPAGWTSLVSNATWGSFGGWGAYVCWKIAASEPSTYSLTATSSDTWQINVFRVTGNNATTPIDQVASVMTAGTADAGAGTTIVCPTVTTTGSDRLICGIAFQPHGLNPTAPGSLTQQFNRAYSGGALTQALGTAAKTTAGATGAFTWTQAAESRQSFGVTVAVAPPSSTTYNVSLTGTATITGAAQAVVAFAPGTFHLVPRTPTSLTLVPFSPSSLTLTPR